MSSLTLCKTRPFFDVEKVASLLSNDGPLSKRLPRFESREEQKRMLELLTQAFNEEGIALIEAGTGTGKSLAYLIPSLLAAALWNEKVVISTHTISLQEQLLNKDLPLLAEATGIEIKAVLVKGMKNYICLRKWDEIAFERELLSSEEANELLEIENFTFRTGLGSKSDLPFKPRSSVLDLIQAEYDTCNASDCPHFQNCYYMQARKSAQDAQILIVNHHLLLSDLAKRIETDNFQGTCLLPSYSRLIVDEAHHLEEIATEFFAKRFSRLELLKTLSKISHEKGVKSVGKIPEIKDRMQKFLLQESNKESFSLMNTLNIDLPALKREAHRLIQEAFHLFEEFLKSSLAALPKEALEGSALRLKSIHYESQAWGGISQSISELSNLLKRYSQELLRVENLAKEVVNDQVFEGMKGCFYDLKALSDRLMLFAIRADELVSPLTDRERIRWIESYQTKIGMNTEVVDASLDLSSMLYKTLFAPLSTVALLSATLSTEGSFSYLRGRLGLTDDALDGRPLLEGIFPSPFDFGKQSLLIIPKNIPSPLEKGFLQEAESVIFDAVMASRGNAFLLFTSYSMLKGCFERLEHRLKEARFFPIKQGDESRSALIKRFKETDRSILFGTDSFWEGVDVVGEALRLVVIAKLPFRVPSEPMVEARRELLIEKGGDPFYEFLLPEALIKLKQGFGRLIRNRNDRGCIVCLDKRIVTKSYGKYFLKSLPPCPQIILEKEAIRKEMEAFYQRTYYLAKKHA